MLKFPKFPIIEINPDYFAGLAATVAGTVTSFTVFTRRRAAR